jgi:hypothetical protein
MDSIEDYRLITCLGEGTATDVDVYDVPVFFPDFTRGRWKTHPVLPIVHL